MTGTVPAMSSPSAPLLSRGGERVRRVKASLRRLQRRVYRIFAKVVYRKVVMCRLEPDQSIIDFLMAMPLEPCKPTIEVLGPDRYHEVLGSSPQLSAADLAHFDMQESLCVVASEADQIVASVWFTHGEVYVSDLGRTVHVPAHERYSGRAYVHPDFRGQMLMQHLGHAHRKLQPGMRMWNLVYASNSNVLAALNKIELNLTGRFSTTFILGMRFAKDEEFDPQPLDAVSTI
jgi:hypothetical protein